MDKEERRKKVNEIEDNLEDIREDVFEVFGVLLNLLDHMQAGEPYPPEVCKRMYEEHREARKSLLRKIDDVLEYDLKNLR